MFILSSIASSWKFRSVNRISMHENSELNAFSKEKKLLGEISSNWFIRNKCMPNS